MKIIIYILLLILSFTACTDFLMRNNPENTANDFFNGGDEKVEQLINAVYATLQKDAFYSRFLPMLCMIRSDEGCLTPNAAKMEENFITLSNYNSDAAEKYTTNLWQDIYIGILRANFAIEKTLEMKNISEEVKKRVLGEAYFLRAFFNLHLVMNYGEAVPVKKSTSKDIKEFEQHPGAEGELWKLIIDDLEQSQSYLAAVNYTNTNNKYQPGRVTLGASTVYLGQAYLFYAQMKGETRFYQKAADELAKVILQQVGTYQLTTNYRDNFTNENEYNLESIFEIGFNYFGTNVWSIDGATGVETSWFSKNAGMSSGCSSSAPRWWNLAPSNVMLRIYEQNDYRKWMNLWCEDGAYYIDKDGVHAYNPSGSQLSMNFPQNDYPKGEGGKYIGFRKYEYDYNQQHILDVMPSTSVSSKFSGMTDVNFRVMRYADVLLMYAECLIIGQTTNPAGKSATSCLTEIRIRANNKLNPVTDDSFQYQYGNANLPYFLNAGTLSSNYSKSADPIVQLQHERFVEFAGEGKRYYDIIRWYKAGVLKNIDPDSPDFEETVTTVAQLADMIKIPGFSGKFLLPIPQYELNTNPKMIGNESN